ncbi:MAG: PleD family two-component system response regulator [Anaerolineales bacterium]|jgi:CheY-like chemotaxis protein
MNKGMPIVMLIEDDITMLSLLRTLLEIEGYQVVNYVPEDDLLTPIRRIQPDIILLDVHYRRINGLDIMRSIRSDSQTRHVKVIMASGESVGSQCLEAGADAFLLKPFMPEDLISNIKLFDGAN